jgi:hypothetical protein
MSLQPHYPDRRTATFRQAQRERERLESQHDKLCIRITREYGMESCWCKCKMCWDAVNRLCICSECSCRSETILLSPTIPRMQRGK